MEMVNRYSNAGSFRYGFNGKEKDNEDYGEGNGYDYGLRAYSSRLGRFFSIDLLTKNYPWYTPFQYSGNKPILATDIDGGEDNPSTYAKPPKTIIVIDNTYTLNKQTLQLSLTTHKAWGDPNGVSVTHNFLTVGDKTFALPQGVTPQQAAFEIYDRNADVRTGKIEGNISDNSYDEVLRSHLVPYSPYHQREIRDYNASERFKAGFEKTLSITLLAAAPVQGLFEETAFTSKGGSPNGAAIYEDAEEAVQVAANNAKRLSGNGSGAVYGTKVHVEFKNQINLLRTEGVNVSAEVSYLNGKVVPYGTKDSVRADVVSGDINAPSTIFELKTGQAKMTKAEINNYKVNVPSSVKTIQQIKPK
jgi:RHS repeat-associated protein